MRHNLSPRGDGNSGGKGTRRQKAGHNLSPRGDGNYHVIHTDSQSTVDTTYPREGTETGLLAPVEWIITRHNLSPRGDGNS